MTITLSRSIPFLLGFSFAFLPNYGPFLGLLFFFTSRWTLTRTDTLWLGAAVLLAVPLGVHEGFTGFTFGVLQVLAPWLLYRTFAQLRTSHDSLVFSRNGGIGLLSGLTLVVGLGWLQIEQLNFDHAKTISQAIVWQANPALYGHTVFALGALMAVLLPGGRKRSLSLVLAALGVLVSGSREAAIAWVIVAFAFLLVSIRRTKRRWIAEAGLFLGMLAVAAGFGPLLGWGRTGFLLDILPPTEATRNLVHGSEILNGDWWDRMGVQVDPIIVSLGDQELTSFTVTKVAPESWHRLQQIVPLSAGTTYTVSVWLKRPKEGIRAGIQGWGQLDRTRRTFTVTGTLVDGKWRSSLSGPGQITGSGIVQTQDEWQRVWISFVYEGDDPLLHFWVGLAPDARQSVGTSATFAAFQLEEGMGPTPYSPGPATKGLSLGIARLPYWQAAWQGISERPLLGWGQDSFPEYYRLNWPDRGRLHNIPAHVHNFFLHILFERGLVGLLGLIIFLIALAHVAIRRGDAAFLIVFAAIMLLNVFDSTLFYGGVIYPLVAISAWRGARYQSKDIEQESITRQVIVRSGLAVIDFTMVLSAFGLAVLVCRLLGINSGMSFEQGLIPPGTVVYAFLLWPAMAWYAGLYPGYGLTAPQELRKQVLSAMYAGFILAAGTVLFATSLPIPRAVLGLMVLLSMLLLPAGRALTKRLLYSWGIWGRSVIILGAGATGQQIARALRDQPLQGLRPVAFFDDVHVVNRNLDLPVRGKLAEANIFAQAANISHAIVAIPRASAEVLENLISVQGRAFRQIQFVPDLKGLPSYGVEATPLDNIFALEVRNELNSSFNRAFKRFLDVVGVILGGLLISPVLLLLSAAIYLDSPGPIFFGHRRIGKDGKAFRTWKFRTMVKNAEAILENHLQRDPKLRQEWENHQKLQSDPRVTRVGKLLRKYSLDELPQLWNVLIGEMSLVGPRPIVEAEVERYHKEYNLYKMVRPGMTGYWQVSGRSDTGYKDRVELDSFYIRNWSVWLDIIILVSTVQVVLRGDGAY
jgi:Undecaprenyl-phosphate galactose phosphotransferase WbaP